MDGLRITLDAQAMLTRMQIDVKSSTDEPEMGIVDTENLRKLMGIRKLDLFYQGLGQSFSHTSMESGLPGAYIPLVNQNPSMSEGNAWAEVPL
ncbi:MAG TPA: hypothetical protein VNP04_21260 [Alphaproteobacteria bacterium]|nr:hypothetical protein [Alphaproteobacteria bacterium]